MARNRAVEKEPPVAEPKTVFHRNADEFNHLSNKLQEYVEEWIATLGLQNWRFKCSYRGEMHQGDPDALAVINADPVYQFASIRFFLLRLVELDDDYDLEEVVVHELCHCHTNAMVPDTDKMTPAERNLLETLTVNTARALMRAKYQKSSGKSGT